MISDKIDCIEDWLHSGNVTDMGKKSGDGSGNSRRYSTSDRERLKELERENRELQRANEILRKAWLISPKRSSTAGRSDGDIYRSA